MSVGSREDAENEAVDSGFVDDSCSTAVGTSTYISARMLQKWRPVVWPEQLIEKESEAIYKKGKSQIYFKT